MLGAAVGKEGKRLSSLSLQILVKQLTKNPSGLSAVHGTHRIIGNGRGNPVTSSVKI